MRLIVININNESIIDELKKLSSYEGGRLYSKEGESLYDLLKIKKQDAPLLDTYIREAVNRLILIANEYLASEDLSQNTFTLNVPDSFPLTYDTELVETAILYVINLSFSLWLLRSVDELSITYYKSASDSNLVDFKKKLYTRDKPTIPAAHPKP